MGMRRRLAGRFALHGVKRLGGRKIVNRHKIKFNLTT